MNETPNLSDAVALWDFDGVIYRAGFACESKQYYVYRGDTLVDVVKTMTEAKAKADALGFPEDLSIQHKQTVEPLPLARSNMKAIVRNVCGKFKCPWEFYLTGKGNFRFDIATIAPYKGNRDLMLKPVHYDQLRSAACFSYKAKIVTGWEADDEVSCRYTELLAEGKTPIVVSNDKDLKQLPGWNYNWVKDELKYVTEREADLAFYEQLLTGDRSDNIIGLDGVGPKTAEKILAKARTAFEMYEIVKKEYAAARRSNDLNENANLLWLQRTRTITPWRPPLSCSQAFSIASPSSTDSTDKLPP